MKRTGADRGSHAGRGVERPLADPLETLCGARVKPPRPSLLLLALTLTVSCRPGSTGGSGEAGASVTAARSALPPEPPPLAADHAEEVPGIEAKLAADAAYTGVWTGPRADLDLFLTWVSELLEAGDASTDITTPLKAKHLHEAGVKLYLVFTRLGSFPADFTAQLAKELAATKREPHLGTWSPWASGQPIHDYSALAAWLNREDAGYLREHIAAKSAGFIHWTTTINPAYPPVRPYLVSELDALNRLALLSTLTPEEESRRAFLASGGNAQPAASATGAPGGCPTMAQYQSVKAGVSKAAVTAILGEGEQLSDTRFAGNHLELVTWKCPLGNASITFHNGRVVTKSQTGL
jgi:hypothetical protein